MRVWKQKRENSPGLIEASLSRSLAESRYLNDFFLTSSFLKDETLSSKLARPQASNNRIDYAMPIIDWPLPVTW